jgi:hypothetical protein
MGASFGYASADSLDMSWLPLPRFESRAVCVAVCGLAGARDEGGATPNIRREQAQRYIDEAVDGCIVRVCECG